MPLLRPPAAGDRPSDHRLIDGFGRVATDLRVSLTDRCNLRCGYCMPAEGLTWLPGDRVLSDAEVVRLITVAVQRLGVRRVRFTGGEPLLRKGLEEIVGATSRLAASLGDQLEIAMTTNGLGLARRAAGLAQACLHRVNVSLDTLHARRFATITRRDRHEEVLAGLAGARAAGLSPIKVNAVLLRGINDDEAPELLRWCLKNGYELRIIEQMPLDAQGAWDRAAMVTADEVLTSLRDQMQLRAEPPDRRGSAPAQRYLVAAGPQHPAGSVGVIASVTRPFCGDCDRTRLTADGQLRNCLFSASETDLRALLRSGCGDDELADAWRGNAWAKRVGHQIDAAGFVQPTRPMSAIGG
jgi:cyclic pyranopterin phosphate synthase